ncbi:hypothetical protein [Sphingobacterium paucimobilis]|uniref:Uncharacterized protein n=1 Tax=Sphingobacterium paucimobilis HER1398 TaxID=1346330 RepID=U2JCM3_9SPHI|nr:hypothetical protein [Sphingobacterium paucimobilis]ERJ60423.1 hypothetical protein M472_16850 [Sphingobacterium paucimobilis HER1398]
MAKKDIDQDLLKRYLENSCSEEERIQVEYWLELHEFTADVLDIVDDISSPKERIWSNIETEITYRQSARKKIVQWARYAVAASVLLIMTLSRPDCLFFTTDAPSNALQIERIDLNDEIAPHYQEGCLYKLSNLGNVPIELKTKDSRRIYTLNRQETYLAFSLNDPGILGDPVLVLSAEQVMMMPDAPLANKIASYMRIDSRKATTTNYL